MSLNDSTGEPLTETISRAQAPLRGRVGGGARGLVHEHRARGGRARVDRADTRRFGREPEHEDRAEQRRRQEQVHDHAGADDDHPFPGNATLVAVGRIAHRARVRVVLAEHLHIAAQRQDVQAVLGGADAPADVRRLAAAHQRFELALRRTRAPPEPLPEREERRSETDGEREHADPRPACREEVPELVHDDDEAEAEQDEQKIERGAEHGVWIETRRRWA